MKNCINYSNIVLSIPGLVLGDTLYNFYFYMYTSYWETIVLLVMPILSKKTCDVACDKFYENSNNFYIIIAVFRTVETCATTCLFGPFATSSAKQF